MRYLAALTALGLIASTAAYAQSSQGNNQSSPSSQAEKSSQAETQSTGTQALSRPFVRQIQIRLHQQGAYDGQPTGTWDSATAKAVQDYQQQHGMQPTGQIDGPTIIALMRPNQGQANETTGEGSSTPTGAEGGGGQARVPMVAVPLMRVYERGYQQGFEQGLRWAEQQAEQQQ